MDHQVRWVTASPLWADLIGSADPSMNGSFGQPALLRFASDTFMTEFLALMQTDPSQLRNLRVQPETWRDLAPLPVPLTAPPKFASGHQSPSPGGATRNGGSHGGGAPVRRGPARSSSTSPRTQRYYLLTAPWSASCRACPTHAEYGLRGAGSRSSFAASCPGRVRPIRPRRRLDPTVTSMPSSHRAAPGLAARYRSVGSLGWRRSPARTGSRSSR